MPGTRYPNAEEHPPFSPFKGGKSVAKRDVIPSKGEFAGLTAQAIERRISRGISYTSLSLIALMIASDLELTASLL